MEHREPFPFRIKGDLLYAAANRRLPPETPVIGAERHDFLALTPVALCNPGCPGGAHDDCAVRGGLSPGGSSPGWQKLLRDVVFIQSMASRPVHFSIRKAGSR
jgi:hypothetical protein